VDLAPSPRIFGHSFRQAHSESDMILEIEAARVFNKPRVRLSTLKSDPWQRFRNLRIEIFLR
jgi:hypothetical protein